MQTPDKSVPAERCSQSPIFTPSGGLSLNRAERGRVLALRSANTLSAPKSQSTPISSSKPVLSPWREISAGYSPTSVNREIALAMDSVQNTPTQGEKSTQSPLGSPRMAAEDVWVMCSNEECGKWRRLRGVFDAATVDPNFVCEMNPDEEYNSCDKAQEHYDEKSEEYVETKFSSGSIVWAKPKGLEWWPAIVECDPDIGICFVVDDENPEIPVEYHVTFLGDKIQRAWVDADYLMAFAESDNPNESEKTGVSKSKKRRINLSELETAKAQAKSAADFPVKERLTRFGFLARRIAKDAKAAQQLTNRVAKQQTPKKAEREMMATGDSPGKAGSSSKKCKAEGEKGAAAKVASIKKKTPVKKTTTVNQKSSTPLNDTVMESIFASVNNRIANRPTIDEMLKASDKLEAEFKRCEAVEGFLLKEQLFKKAPTVDFGLANLGSLFGNPMMSALSIPGPNHFAPSNSLLFGTSAQHPGAFQLGQPQFGPGFADRSSIDHIIQNVRANANGFSGGAFSGAAQTLFGSNSRDSMDSFDASIDLAIAKSRTITDNGLPPYNSDEAIEATISNVFTAAMALHEKDLCLAKPKPKRAQKSAVKGVPSGVEIASFAANVSNGGNFAAESSTSNADSMDVLYPAASNLELSELLQKTPPRAVKFFIGSEDTTPDDSFSADKEANAEDVGEGGISRSPAAHAAKAIMKQLQLTYEKRCEDAFDRAVEKDLSNDSSAVGACLEEEQNVSEDDGRGSPSLVNLVKVSMFAEEDDAEAAAVSSSSAGDGETASTTSDDRSVRPPFGGVTAVIGGFKPVKPKFPQGGFKVPFKQ